MLPMNSMDTSCSPSAPGTSWQLAMSTSVSVRVKLPTVMVTLGIGVPCAAACCSRAASAPGVEGDLDRALGGARSSPSPSVSRRTGARADTLYAFGRRGGSVR
jgi:hypothetical protein